MFKKSYPHLRLVVDNDPRMYAQSTSERSSSHLTVPPDSRSIRIDRDSAGERKPYAMFRRWPAVVPHRSANPLRSAVGNDFQKVLKSTANYHHTVIENATPNVEFTEWCAAGNNEQMETAEIRRRNLLRLLERDFGGNKSELARAYDSENPKPQYFSDLLRKDSGKSFGEKAARKIEERTGLLPGQLDIPDSELLQDERKRSRLRDEIRRSLDEFGRDEQREVLDAIRRIQSRNRIKRAG